ncbi:flagellar M-ring protein FliF C-terminal domain-containing protein [Actinoplanes sp. L3-i22]|uniref:flagellar M-ring protein FliF C-terminal domain-containing protein n=1 Tax=Actinoplanes sp. L3-i22 TaxID=2836373 RepID=UPI001C842AA0|nr:flagellar M-ring protein FliF C-terminal domain-containing protein [Actinoplanes sp. L3-i22]
MEVEEWMTDTPRDLQSPTGQARSRLRWKILTIVAVLALLTGGVFLATRPSGPTALTARTTKPVASTGPVTVTDPRTLAFQTRLDQSLQTMLDSLLGPGNSVVTTTATLDFVPVDPGVLGPDDIQVPDGSGSAAAGRGETIDNAVSEANEVRTSAPGVVKRLVIVVRMNIAVAGDVDPAQVARLVSTAAGIDPARGDSVTVLT